MVIWPTIVYGTPERLMCIPVLAFGLALTRIVRTSAFFEGSSEPGSQRLAVRQGNEMDLYGAVANPRAIRVSPGTDPVARWPKLIGIIAIIGGVVALNLWGNSL